MKKWLLVTSLLVIVGLYAFCLSQAHPSNAVIKREFILQNPQTEIVEITLISDEVAITTYKINYRKVDSNEIFSKTFTLQQCLDWDWKSNYKECN